MSQHLAIHPEVAQALQQGTAVVALETAVATAGLPREPLAEVACNAPGWRTDQPMNLELSMLLERLVRQHGAIPATVAVLDGVLHIGLKDDQLERLAREVSGKVSVSSMAHTLATGASAGTTVAATLAACQLTPRPIRVFATGGIGGVHRHWTELPDVSADLRQLAISPTCVVCAGAKSILDLPATLEALEAMGVPVLGYRTDQFPQFQSSDSDALPVPRRIDDVQRMAELCRTHWDVLGMHSGLLLAQLVEKSLAVDAAELEQANQMAEENAIAAGAVGERRTPYLLAEVARLTNGRSLQANLALLASNAILAAKLSVALSEMQ
jgi:pseudouridine-5'-phosphate glycosidase